MMAQIKCPLPSLSIQLITPASTITKIPIAINKLMTQRRNINAMRATATIKYRSAQIPTNKRRLSPTRLWALSKRRIDSGGKVSASLLVFLI
jgi:hypothetical protein